MEKSEGEKNQDLIGKIINWIQKQDKFDVLLLTKILALIIEPSPSQNKQPKLLPRKNFSEYVKNEVLARQLHLCNSCNIRLDEVNYDHIDRDRTNNSSWNCQALCPNCHAKKTRNRFTKLI